MSEHADQPRPAEETPQLGGRLRTRSVVRGILTSGLSRGISALAPVATVPIALHFLGAAGYGAWTAALALTALTTFADLGMGAGLMTRVADALSAGRTEEARQLTTSAYLSLTAFVAVALTALWASANWVDWAVVVAGSAVRGDRDVALVALVTLSGFLFNVVAMLIVRVQYAAQEVARSNIWQSVGAGLGVVAIVLASRVAHGPVAFVAVAAFTPGLVSLVNSAWFFHRGRGRAFRPRLSAFSSSVATRLVALGSRFLVISVLMAGSLGIDSWIVAHTTDLAVVPEYAVPSRVFAVVGTLVSVLATPLWPAHAAALASGDTGWVVRITRRMTLLSPLLVGGTSLVAVLVSGPAFRHWLGADRPVPGLLLLTGLALWNTVQALAGPMFMVQNAVGVLRPQMIGYALLLVIVPVKWFVSARYGFEWLPVVSSVAYALVIWPCALWGYRRSVSSGPPPPVPVAGSIADPAGDLTRNA